MHSNQFMDATEDPMVATESRGSGVLSMFEVVKAAPESPLAEEVEVLRDIVGLSGLGKFSTYLEAVMK